LRFSVDKGLRAPILNSLEPQLEDGTMNNTHKTIAPSLLSHLRPISRAKRVFREVTGNPVQKDFDEYWRTVESVKATDLSAKSDSYLSERIAVARLLGAGQANPGIHHYIEVEIFAIVREAARRTIGLNPFDVQLIAGLAMGRGCIAELPTGEGKTLAAVFTACLRSLAGQSVHVLTFNDYLARRDAAWMGPIYSMLGLNVGCIQEGMSPSEKRAAYACDVTYGAAKEVGFDFLRDQIAYDRESLVHRPFHFALVDEADSILIDEARIPLVISGAEGTAIWDTHRLVSIVNALIPGRDFETDDEHRNVFLTDAGLEHVESLLGCGSLYAAENQSLLEATHCALHAHALLRRDVDYIVRNKRIEIVDEYTGRVVEKRHWPDGLQAAVEAQEGLSRKTQRKVLGSITLQHFFNLYPAIGGMTGTAQSAADEFYEFYGMKVVVVLPHIPSIRVDHPDVVFTHRDAKRRAIVREISEVHALQRPILVGTASVKESEELAGDLRSAGIRCTVLNAKNDEREASIIAEAGMPCAVTISTNMAGRGVDIKLGGNDERYRDAVTAMGGLYVIGTNRHESFRIDRQLRGRAGRQGEPGATRFFISLEDDLFEHYGLSKTLMKKHRLNPQPDSIPGGSIQREIVHAQRIIEGQNFDIRRSLDKYSSLIELQRQIVQTRREKALLCVEDPMPDSTPYKPEQSVEAPNKFSCREPALYERGLNRFGPEKMTELERCATLFHLDRLWSDHLAWIQDTRDSIHLVNLGGQEPIEMFRKWATTEFLKMREAINEAVIDELTAIIQKNGSVDADIDRLRGPSSTWTYLVNDNPFAWGIEMLKTKNIGFGGMAALVAGPLFLWTLHKTKKIKAHAKDTP
jgi:preprotein translocase subunit SecA